MAEAEGFFLADGDDLGHAADRVDFGQEVELAALLQRALELRGAVEVVEDGVLPLRHHDDQLVEAGAEGLLDPVLQDGAVDQRQHLLGDDFRRREKARAEAGAGEDAGAQIGHVVGEE